MFRPFRLFLTLILISALSFIGLAQGIPYGNEWIVEGQEYFKISTWQTGIYKLSYHQLSDAGVPLSSVDASTIQLFHRGKEINIEITGGDDGEFNTSDTLVFWGQANDGTLDSLLYKPHSARSNKHLNLYSDTTAYFLTWGASGKRMPLVSDAAALPAADLYLESLLLFKDAYEQGELWSETRLSSFGRGEGWSGVPIVKGAAAASAIRTFDIPIQAPVSGKGAFLDLLLYGNDQNPHVIEILLGDPASPDTVVQVPVFTGHIDQKVQVAFSSSFISGATCKVSVRALGNPGVADRVSVPYIKLVYPSGSDMAGKTNITFQRADASQNQSFSINNVPAGARIYDITDAYEVKIVQPSSVAGGTHVFPAHPGSGRFHINSSSTFLTSHSIEKVELRNLHLSNPSVSNVEFLIITHPKLFQAAQAYNSYRTETGYNSLVALTTDLYNQFSYGEVTPLAIHNFCRYLADSVQPEYMFIIGKALDINYRSSAVARWYRWNPSSYTSLGPSNSEYVEDLVPAGGHPTSDLVYTMGKGGSDEFVPAFPVGRLHAKNEGEVYAYLEKVMQHEALPDTLLWRKHVLHLSGGGNQTEIDIFKQRLLNLEPMVRDSVFGGRVSAHIVKRRGFYVDDELIGAVSSEVNKGVSYITFLGHASPTFPDLDVGFVSNKLYGYNNEGKYPLLIINGCNVVNASSPRSLAEDWLQTPKKGAVAAIGHAHMGYTGLLEIYTRRMYKYLFNTRMVYEQNYALGDVQKLAIIDQLVNTTVYNKAMMQQYLLQGDPSIRIYFPGKPDFAITGVNLKPLDNLPVTALSDSFALKIVVPDFGITSPDSLKITVSRTVGTNVFHYDTVLYRPVFYQDTLIFVVRNTGNEGFGMNTFTVRVDPGNEIAELNEMNNIYTFQYFIPHTVVQPLFPKEFSIVSSQPVLLTAQATNILNGTTAYYLELDTTNLFNSPFKRSTVINAGGLVRWEQELLPDMPEYDSTVYFWRVRFNIIPADEDTIWGESSFTYIKDGPEGWSQSKFAEFRKDRFTDIEYYLENESLTFPKTEIWVSSASPGNKYVGPDPTKSSTYWAGLGLNGDPIIYEDRGGCGAGIYAITFDKSTILPYYPIPSYPTCGRFWSGKRINSFTQLNNTSLTGGARSQGGLIAYLEAVKPGDYVLLMSNGNAYMDVWSDTLKNQMKAVLGAELLDSLQNEMPYIILARKGAGDAISEQYGSIDEIIYLDYHLEGKLNNGIINSTTIGPASTWNTLYKRFELEATDTVITGILGISFTGARDTLYNGIVPDEFDLSGIDAAIYPYIQLYTHVFDSTSHTPAGINKWQVLNSGVPEGTLDPYKFGVDKYTGIVKQEGQDLSVDFNFYNISLKDFSDSLRVKVSLIDVSTGNSTVSWLDLPKLPADSGVDFNYTINTFGHVGSYILQVYVNPQLQAEEFYHNNVLEIPITIKEDKTNPVLDVTFDGIHIIDGDIISPNPMIAITMRDENPYLIMNDTTGMELYLKRPCSGCDFEPVNFSDPEILSWGQSSANGNKFRIEYNPKNLPDGVYTLLVQGADVSGNKSGMQPYKISFEVINESSITNFYPYPNPFSTSTRFVFTLTGSKVPDDLKIQVMTVTGKVVREIRKEELGAIRIGNNISDFSWDGTDQFGDRLANGVYLYRVIIKDADDFSHRKTEGDKAFHKNFGKLYILR